LFLGGPDDDRRLPELDLDAQDFARRDLAGGGDAD
jgi:hypothetical protein